MEELPHLDPYIWLESLDDDKVANWIEQRNHNTLNILCDHQFEVDKKTISAILNSPEMIPMPTRRGSYLYNFWRDSDHVKGIWRRTSEASYRSTSPDWDIILDIDALAENEDRNWVFGGALFAPDNPARALIYLSEGGGDTTTAREYDLDKRSFVEVDAFVIENSKSSASWVDENTLLVSSALQQEEQTASGYARVVKRWRRGTSLAEAEIIFSGEYSDVVIYGSHDYRENRSIFLRLLDFFNTEAFIEEHGGKRLKLDLPSDVTPTLKHGWLTVRPRRDYLVEGRQYLAGSLLIIDWLAFKNGARNFTELFTPGPRKSLASLNWLGKRLAISILDDLTQSFSLLSFEEGEWHAETTTLERGESGSMWPLDSADLAHLHDDNDEKSGQYLRRISGYLRPPTLFQITPGKEPEQLHALPEFFDSKDMEVAMHHAPSTDGEKIPYMQIGKKNLSHPAPLLLAGYGGFEHSLLPDYTPLIGKLWLETGGIYVVANIRGGGEFGPAWHEAGRKQGKILSHDDFAAVAQDLIAQGITTRSRQACQGASNGGLLVGAMLTRYPELFGAIVCQVPLLDMFRYTKLPPGVSWVSEYGDPEKPEDWEYIQQLSPYHLLKKNTDYPPLLVTTSSRDDRVHPGHARKMVAKMEAMGYAPFFHEPRDGGHAGATDKVQTAFNTALVFSFLRMTVMKSQPSV